MKLKTLILILTSFISVYAFAQNEDKPSMSTSQIITRTATVTAINQDTREVTLQAEDGTSVDIVASEQVRNLGQVSVGDIVVAQIVETLNIEVMAVENAQAMSAEALIAARSEEGNMPGVGVMDSRIEVASVVAIDLQDNTFKLQFSDGSINQFAARDPNNLRLADIGDVVVMEYTTSLALTVEKATAE